MPYRKAGVLLELDVFYGPQILWRLYKYTGIVHAYMSSKVLTATGLLAAKEDVQVFQQLQNTYRSFNAYRRPIGLLALIEDKQVF